MRRRTGCTIIVKVHAVSGQCADDIGFIAALAKSDLRSLIV